MKNSSFNQPTSPSSSFTEAIKRTLQDLTEIQSHPIPGVSLIIPNANNPFILHGNIKIEAGLYKDIIPHLIVRIPDEYPTKPPAVNIAPGLEFGHRYHRYIYDDQIYGNSICTDLTSKLTVPSSQAEDSDNHLIDNRWTSEHTLSSIMKQLQSFFANPSLSEEKLPSEEDIIKLKRHSEEYRLDIKRTTSTGEVDIVTHSYEHPYPPLSCETIGVANFQEEDEEKEEAKIDHLVTAQQREVCLDGGTTSHDQKKPEVFHQLITETPKGDSLETEKTINVEWEKPLAKTADMNPQKGLLSSTTKAKTQIVRVVKSKQSQDHQVDKAKEKHSVFSTKAFSKKRSNLGSNGYNYGKDKSHNASESGVSTNGETLTRAKGSNVDDQLTAKFNYSDLNSPTASTQHKHSGSQSSESKKLEELKECTVTTQKFDERQEEETIEIVCDKSLKEIEDAAKDVQKPLLPIASTKTKIFRAVKSKQLTDRQDSRRRNYSVILRVSNKINLNSNISQSKKGRLAGQNMIVDDRRYGNVKRTMEKAKRAVSMFKSAVYQVQKLCRNRRRKTLLLEFMDNQVEVGGRESKMIRELVEEIQAFRSMKLFEEKISEDKELEAMVLEVQQKDFDQNLTLKMNQKVFSTLQDVLSNAEPAYLFEIDVANLICSLLRKLKGLDEANYIGCKVGEKTSVSQQDEINKLRYNVIMSLVTLMKNELPNKVYTTCFETIKDQKVMKSLIRLLNFPAGTTVAKSLNDNEIQLATQEELLGLFEIWSANEHLCELFWEEVQGKDLTGLDQKQKITIFQRFLDLIDKAEDHPEGDKKYPSDPALSALHRITSNLSHFFDITIAERTCNITKDTSLPIPQAYQEYLQPYCVDTIPILSTDDIDFTKKSHYYSSHASKQNTSPETKTTRIMKELSELANSLPVSHTNAILVRYDTIRMDVLKVLIFGAASTPYAHGAFEFDIFIPDDYPSAPPLVSLMTTGNGAVRFNPNLYSCGKVCLSLLGTWYGDDSENWNPNESTILQVLISIQSIIMTEDILYNEPGFEDLKATEDGVRYNEGYSNIVKYASVRFAMIEAIKNPPACFKEPVLIHFYLKKSMIMKEVNGWIAEARNSKGFYTGLVSCHNYTYASEFRSRRNNGKKRNLYYKMLKEATGELQKLLDTLNLRVESMFTGRKIEWKRKKSVGDAHCGLKPGSGLTFADVREIDVGYDEEIQYKKIDLNDEKVTNRWSRYIGAMGRDAVEKQADSSVLIVGLNAVGVEIAKNIVLSGIKRLTICDGKKVEINDLAGQFSLDKSSIGRNRAEACVGKLQALNHYVQIDVIKEELRIDRLGALLSDIRGYSVLVCCEGSIGLQVSLNNYCRSCDVLFVSSTVKGLFSRVFCDFGPSFQILDKTGEEQRELIVKEIGPDGIVSMLSGVRHGLQDGDLIKFTQGEEHGDGESFVDKSFEVIVKDSSSFSIGDVSSYRSLVSGVIRTLKRQETLTYKSLAETLDNPVLDASISIADLYAGPKQTLLHFASLTVDKYMLSRTNSPQDRVALAITSELSDTLLKETLDEIKLKSPDTFTAIQDNKDLAECLLWVSKMLMTYNGVFPPLCAFIGGLTAQEVIKGITRKYTPIKQYFYYECFDLKAGAHEASQQLAVSPLDEGDKYGPLRICLGDELCNKLKDTKLFLVGVGAIGCELLKNCAMLGLGTGQGKIVLTDPDVIENSNLNRRFLFREKHIRQAKASTAAAVSIQMNPDLEGKVLPMLEKVHEGSELFTDQFLEGMDVVTNALDNVSARRYVDSRCVRSRIPLLESGTLGSKGHVQVIIPFKTESYSSQQDPQENREIPYCTLRMFPQETVHCIEWARDKFSKMFTQKPSSYMKALEAFESNQLETLDEKILKEAARFSQSFPETFEDCVQWALTKYHKLFVYDIEQLLDAYPLDFRTQDGQLFWSLPKRPPHPLQYDTMNQYHAAFITASACIRATIFGIITPEEARTAEFRAKTAQLASMLQPKAYKAMNNKVKKNESNQEKEEETVTAGSLGKEDYLSRLTLLFKGNNDRGKQLICNPQEFEKDVDENFHVDFLHAMTNCRAMNYCLESVDWLDVKLRAGRITPALATTTAAIAGLQTIELCKLLAKCSVSQHKNSFLNLSLPVLAQSEPMAAPEYELRKGLRTNMWDRWDVHLDENSHIKSLKDLFQHLKEMTGLVPMDLLKGSVPIYIHTLMEMHGKAQEKEMLLSGMLDNVLQRGVQTSYVDITVTFTSEEKKANCSKDVMLKGVPSIRVHFNVKGD